MRLKHLYILLSLVLIAFLLGFSSLRSKREPIRSIAISLGDTARGHFVQKAEIIELLRRDGIDVQTPLRRVALEKIETRVKRSPYIADAQVSRSIDGKLEIAIRQKQALARLHSPQGDCYLSEQGGKVPLCKGYAPAVILVRGAVEDRDLQDVKNLIRTLRQRPFLSKFIIGISLEQTDYLLDTRAGTHRVLLGRAEHIGKKLDKLSAFYREVLSAAGWKGCRLINLKYSNQVICTKS